MPNETNEQTNEIDSIQSIKFVPGSKINDREIIYKTIIITLTATRRTKDVHTQHF